MTFPPDPSSPLEAVFSALSPYQPSLLSEAALVALVFLFAGLCALARARLFFVLALGSAALEIAAGLGWALPAWVSPVLFALAVASTIQLVLNLTIGEQAASNIYSALLIGAVLFFLLRGPRGGVRLLLKTIRKFLWRSSP